MEFDKDPYEGIDVNLDSEAIEESRKPIPDKPTNFRVAVAERKVKDEAGKFPFIKLTIQPETGDEKVDRRKFFFNASFHPDMLWQMKEIRSACGLPIDVSARDLLKNQNSDQEFVGCRFSTVPKIKAHPNDPDRKVNEIVGPFRRPF